MNTENKSSIEKNENTNVNPAGNAEITLRQTPIGMPAIITQVGGSGPLRQHFLDMGVIPGSEVTIVQLAPMGDPMELRIHGYELTIRDTQRRIRRRKASKHWQKRLMKTRHMPCITKKQMLKKLKIAIIKASIPVWEKPVVSTVPETVIHCPMTPF